MWDPLSFCGLAGVASAPAPALFLFGILVSLCAFMRHVMRPTHRELCVHTDQEIIFLLYGPCLAHSWGLVMSTYRLSCSRISCSSQQRVGFSLALSWWRALPVVSARRMASRVERVMT